MDLQERLSLDGIKDPLVVLFLQRRSEKMDQMDLNFIYFLGLVAIRLPT
jgi:hypothetical protein